MFIHINQTNKLYNCFSLKIPLLLFCFCLVSLHFPPILEGLHPQYPPGSANVHVRALTFSLRAPARAVLMEAPNTPDRTIPVSTLEYWGAKSTGLTLNPKQNRNQSHKYKCHNANRKKKLMFKNEFLFVPAVDNPANPSAIIIRTEAVR